MPFGAEYVILGIMTQGEPPVHPFYPGLQLPAKEDKTMKILKALLAVFTFLAAALTCALLFVQDKHAPRYIQIYTGEHD